MEEMRGCVQCARNRVRRVSARVDASHAVLPLEAEGETGRADAEEHDEPHRALDDSDVRRSSEASAPYLGLLEPFRLALFTWGAW